MSDELKNKNGKVKVMYVRSDDDSDRRTRNPRTGKGGGSGGRRPVIVTVLPVVTSRVAIGKIVNRIILNMMFFSVAHSITCS